MIKKLLVFALVLAVLVPMATAPAQAASTVIAAAKPAVPSLPTQLAGQPAPTARLSFQEPASTGFLVWYIAWGMLFGELAWLDSDAYHCEQILGVWIAVGDQYGFHSADANAVAQTYMSAGCGYIIT